MAGDWIKMRVDLQDDPAVVAMCDKLDLDEYSVIGRLHRLWAWADKHTSDGVTSGVTTKWVDRYVCQPGFAQAMIDAQWLKFEDGVLSFPGFEIHNGKSAKSRCDAVIRQRQSRLRHNGVTNGGDKCDVIPKPFVRAVYERDEYTCVYCGTESSKQTEASGKRLLSVDHIIPKSRGSGRQAIEDLATCCKLCNNEKNDRTPEEWGLLPKFLAEGVAYNNGTIVTEKRDECVTSALPEKRREEKSNTHTHTADEQSIITNLPDWLGPSWLRLMDHLFATTGRRVDPIRAETMAMSLVRSGEAKALADIEFTILKGGKSILDSANDFEKRKATTTNTNHQPRKKLTF
jgi:hypothetical protein